MTSTDITRPIRATAQPLAMWQIQKAAPSVFAERPWEGVSDRYTFIPTVKVMENLMTEGWNVMYAGQQKTRLPGKKEFTRHVLRMRRSMESVKVDDLFPEIVIINAHDRGAAYQLHAGFFRMVCGNGLIVADSIFSKLAVRHSGNILDEVRTSADRIAEEFPRITNSIEQMRSIELTPNERGIFARSAAALKYDSSEEAPIVAERLLVSRRYSDNKPDLWSTMNTVQENIIKGGVRLEVGKNKTRGVKSIQEDTRLNKSIWMLAEEMKKIKQERA